eukprot:TRINITY_DN27377_c0_g1_i1.p1 TRINITY_DN27377_c0_g1~~TRINITY_DN27377_c0_g1_i1.p1  ORF type:complete len:325 (-),score=91.80 TRINITY_DN27377_c0_g1_i1:111-1085(-)
MLCSAAQQGKACAKERRRASGRRQKSLGAVPGQRTLEFMWRRSSGSGTAAGETTAMPVKREPPDVPSKTEKKDDRAEARDGAAGTVAQAQPVKAEPEPRGELLSSTDYLFAETPEKLSGPSAVEHPAGPLSKEASQPKAKEAHGDASSLPADLFGKAPSRGEDADLSEHRSASGETARQAVTLLLDAARQDETALLLLEALAMLPGGDEAQVSAETQTDERQAPLRQLETPAKVAQPLRDRLAARRAAAEPLLDELASSDCGLSKLVNNGQSHNFLGGLPFRWRMLLLKNSKAVQQKRKKQKQKKQEFAAGTKRKTPRVKLKGL